MSKVISPEEFRVVTDENRVSCPVFSARYHGSTGLYEEEPEAIRMHIENMKGDPALPHIYFRHTNVLLYDIEVNDETQFNDDMTVAELKKRFEYAPEAILSYYY